MSKENSCPYLHRATTVLSHLSPTPFPLHLSPSIKTALERKLPIVALESTLISHGLPYPQNLEVANKAEEIVRNNGAVPATIAILDGVIKVGLTSEDLGRLASPGAKILKASVRDLPIVVSKKWDAATTVAATATIASWVGIKVFATGGLGGVHRDGHNTMDVSADLTVLGTCPIAVVCAGAKSILDIPRTLEYMETQGTLVVGYKTNDFPAFFVPRSGCPVPYRLDTPEEFAQLIYTHFQLNLNSGIVIAVPIKESDAALGDQVEKSIQIALKDAETKGIAGKELTPFLLARINQLTSGTSLKANVALILQNVGVAAEIASCLARLEGMQEF